MTWLAWRQFRVPALVLTGAAVALAFALVVVGVPAAGEQALQLFSADRARSSVLTIASLAVLGFPAVIGMFWGAPLVARELEAGTHRLIWTQSITRTRWLATKVALIGLSAMAVAGLLGLLLTWWTGPLDDAIALGAESDGIAGMPRMEPVLFAARGIAPIGYAAFAFALGVTSGVLIRRTVPAMAVTAVVFALVQFAVPPLVRAHLNPVVMTTTVTPENLRGLLMSGPDGPVVDLEIQADYPGAWLIGNDTLDRSGNPAGLLPSYLSDCVRPDPERQGPLADPVCFKRFADDGYRQRLTYQPADRYWTLQAVEVAGFLVLAGGLLALSFFWVRRRIS